ncbi:MAG: autotransporter-associated beta strand repeat-containing protein, partial [Nitrospira sp.]|nr:autotransporter-associated beta strand repeat-containing protein [Nitrospira sp.]
MISLTTPMKVASPDQADRRDGWFSYAGNLTGLLMVALFAGHGTGLAEPPAPTQLPTGEQVVGGAATISRQQATMTINQGTSRAAIDWQNFDIGSQAHVNIRQPSTDSVLFNRILGNNPSQIFGGLTANGQVYLSNPSGFYFAPSASVNVGGLVATTHQLSLDEFMAGRDRFSRNGSTGRLLNEGQLKAALGGYIALLAPEVRNHGVIMAELGTVALAAGEAYELRFDPARRLEGLRVEPAQIRTLVENKQAVLAPGGLIVLSAQGASQLQGSVVRHDGTLEASSLVSKGGRIVLEGDAITLGAHSTTTASGATGGGEVLVGGGWQGSGPLKHATSTTVETGATIDVSATQRGDGGTAVLWSDVRNPIGRTQVSGSILASGGAQSGNGGRIETSGHTLQVEDSTHISTLAPHGRLGEWLLDPVDFTIASGSGAQTTSSIGAATLGTALNSGNVTIATDASTGGNGDITVAANVTKTASSGTTTLTLKSHRSVVMNNGISINGAAGAPLNVVFWADSDNSGGGGVQLRNVTTQGGHLYLGGGTASTTWNGLTVPNGPTKSFGGLAPTHFTGTLSTAGGDVYLWNGTGAGAAGQFTTAGGSGVDVFNAGVGNITLRVDAVNILNNLTITTTGLFSLLPSTSGGSFRDPVLTSKYILTGAQGGLTIGTSGNTADITHQTNAYSTNGPIQLHGGTVTLNAGLTTTNASTGDVSITASTGLTGSGGITLANGRTLTVTQSGNTTYNGVISGSGAGLTKLGIGDLSLGGASTYTGATTVSGGILSLAAADRLPDSTALTVDAGATFSLNGFNETVGSIAGNGLIVNGAVVRDGLVLWLDAGNTSSYNGTGNTWYDLSGNGYHGTIYGSPTYSSANSLFTFANNSQYVRLSTLPANFLGSTVTGMTIFSVANFGTTADNWERVVDLGNAGAGGNAPNHHIILSRYGTGSRLNWEIYNGPSGNTANQSNTNTAITNGKASYAGTADGSNLKIYKDGALNTTTASTALPGAAARADNYIGKSNWTADDTFRGDIGTLMVYNRALSAIEIAKNHQLLFNRSTATLTAGGDNTNTTFSGTIENGVGTSNMVKQGTGTLTLTGANSYAGTTTVEAGMLRNGATNVVPQFSAVSVASGATWDLNSYNNTVGAVAGAGNIPLGSGTLTTGGLNTSTSFSGVVSGTGGVSKSGTGTWTLSGANSYSGATTVSGGTLTSGATGSLPDASAVTLNSGTTLNLNSFTETVGSLSGAGDITLGSAALTSSGNGTNTTYSGVISGTGSLIKAGSGTLTLTGTNSYSGATTVSDGTLAVGNGGSTGTLGNGVVTSNAALVFNRSGNVALSTMASNAGGIGGTGSVSATASGDLTIDRSISVGGPVTLTADNGNLAINSAVTTPASTITLSAGGSGGTVTQGVSGSLSATNLALLGGNVTLEHSANAISTLAASGVTTLTYADSDALTIGTVGATTGINATGPVRIETLSGDLTVAQNIATTNTGTSALILNAGKATAAGTITGGNLLISGAPTVTIGSGGRATLYSGSINGSTGLTGLVGSGSGRFRYNSDESTTNYTLALGSGLHVIYRENPTVSVAVENKTMTYGDALPTWTYTTSGMANGDQVAQAFASPSVSVGGTTSTSGSYTAGNHTLTASGMTSSQLGYSVGTLTNGTMTVNTRSTTVSGLTAADKVYDGTTTA